MKNGKNLQELGLEIQRQAESKRDFMISTPKIKAYGIDNKLELAFPLKEVTETEADFFAGSLTRTGHEHMGSWAGIPKTYYDVMLKEGNVGLLAKNVQHWLDKSSDRRLIRVLDGNIRGILSDRYRRLDNYDLLMAIMPMLIEAGAGVSSCEITDRKLYIKFTTHAIQGEVKKNDIVELGGIISNSEIGFGSLSIQPLILRKVCDNGLILNDLAYRKYHVGKKQAETTIDITYSDVTNEAIDKAFWLQTKDTIKSVLSQTTLDKAINMIEGAVKREIKNPQVAMELVQKKFNFNEDESNNILAHLIKGGDLTNWGMCNATTRMAQDVESYDRSVELETLASQMLAMNLN